MKVSEGQKVQLGERRFATVTSEGTLIIEATYEGPLGDDRARCIGLSLVESQALLDLLANGEAVEHSVQADETPCPLDHKELAQTGSDVCPECGEVTVSRR